MRNQSVVEAHTINASEVVRSYRNRACTSTRMVRILADLNAVPHTTIREILAEAGERVATSAKQRTTCKSLAAQRVEWTDEMLDKVRGYVADNLSVESIATKMGLTHSQIRNAVARVGGRKTVVARAIADENMILQTNATK